MPRECFSIFRHFHQHCFIWSFQETLGKDKTEKAFPFLFNGRTRWLAKMVITGKSWIFYFQTQTIYLRPFTTWNYKLFLLSLAWIFPLKHRKSQYWQASMLRIRSHKHFQKVKTRMGKKWDNFFQYGINRIGYMHKKGTKKSKAQFANVWKRIKTIKIWCCCTLRLTTSEGHRGLLAVVCLKELREIELEENRNWLVAFPKPHRH